MYLDTYQQRFSNVLRMSGVQKVAARIGFLDEDAGFELALRLAKLMVRKYMEETVCFSQKNVI